ncbi:MAG: stage III sporulation protein AE [Firmicutes bacterium]|jgi:stage III sporulation protein AE|nr:stage III sporulation protein AE [Bacillota bacterium]
MNWRLFLSISLLLMLLSVPVRAQEIEVPDVDLSALQNTVNALEIEWKSFLPDLSLKGLLTEAQSAHGFDWRTLTQGLTRYFFREVVAGSKLLGQLLILVVFAALLSTLEQSFPVQGAVRMAQALMFIMVITVAIQSFHVALATGKNAIDNMVSFMQALLPILFTMLAACGGIASTAVLHPFLLATITILGTVTQDIIFPLLYLSTVLSLVTYVVPEVNVGRLASFISGACITLLGLVLCAFVGVSAVQGATAKVADGVSIRSAKFLAASFVPVIGKLFADALEAVVGYSTILQTAVSTVGMLLLLLICAFPLLKIMALIVVYKLAAALAEPIADTRVARCLGGLGNSLGLIFATVGVVALLFFLALTALVGIGSLPWGRGG